MEDNGLKSFVSVYIASDEVSLVHWSGCFNLYLDQKMKIMV